MFKAKKITAFALIFAMMASFTACSKVDTEAVTKKVETFAKAAASLDADSMLKVVDGVDDDTKDKIEDKLAMYDLDSDERAVKKAIAETITYKVDNESVTEGKKEGTFTCNVTFTMVDYAKVLSDASLKDADSMTAAVKASKDTKKYKVTCELVLKKEKYYIKDDTLKYLADLYSFLDADIKFGPSSSDIVAMVDYTKWYGSTDGYYTNTAKIELDLYFKDNPGIDYYYKVLRNGDEVYKSSPIHIDEYFAEAVYSSEQNAAMDDAYLADGSYDIQFYMASDDSFITSNSTYVTVAKATPTPTPADIPTSTDSYEIYNNSFAKLKEVKWFEYDEDEGTRVKDGVYYADVKNLAFSIEVYEEAGEIYYAYYYIGSGEFDKETFDYSKPDYSDTIKTYKYDDDRIYYDIDYTPETVKPGKYVAVVAASKDTVKEPYIIAVCTVLEQKSTDI